MASMHEVQAEPSLNERRAALESVLNSVTFSRNPRLGKLLEYLCSKAFAGESGSLKEYTIATDVFGRPADFDQSTDAIVRVEMHRLRKKLKDFYAGEGLSQNIEIVIHSGHYAPEFVERHTSVSEWKPEALPAPLTQPLTFPTPQQRRWVPVVIVGSAALIAAIALFALGTRYTLLTSAGHPAISGSGVTVAAGHETEAIRILSGRLHSRFRDREGNDWGSDTYFEGGTALELPLQPIYRTRNPSIFLGARSGDFSYKIPLKPGIYELHLYFVDTSFSPAMSMEGGESTRIFQVDLNGKRILQDFDIVASAGPSTAYERVFKDVQPDKDGYLHVQFKRTLNDALLSAIEILPGTPHRIRPIRILTQDSGFTDKNGNYWAPDNYFLNGRSVAKSGLLVAGPADAQIFERERFGNFSYALPAAPGNYRLALYFAETYFGPGEPGGGGVGNRIFDVYCNGQLLLNKLDVFREAGSRRELTKIFDGLEPNAQGNVLISFVPRNNYGMVSAIELIDESSQ